MSITNGAWSHKAWKTPGNSLTGVELGAEDNEGVFVIHAVHLHTGKIMWWSGHAEGVHYVREIVVWDPTVTVPETDPAHAGKQMPDISNRIIHLPPGDLDIFCAFHVQLHDGKILIMGGSQHGPSHPGSPSSALDGRGIKSVFIFDPSIAPGADRKQAFTQKSDMNQGRWYPTAVVMEDKSVLVFSGRADTATLSLADEVSILNPPNYNPRVASFAAPGGNLPVLPSYPSMHMVKGGNVFYTGTNWKYEAQTALTTPAFTNVEATINLRKVNNTTLQWEHLSAAAPFPNSNGIYREEGASVLLSPAKEGKILVVGGNFANYYAGATLPPASPNPYPALSGNNSTNADILFTQGGTPHWHSSTPQGLATPLQTIHPRINVSTVLLVDGTVLILGGHNKYKWGVESTFSKKCEIFTPQHVGTATNPFREVAELNEPRTYHSTALLLKDGSVVVGGGVNPNKVEGFPGSTRPTNNSPGTVLNQKTFEIYKPPYLFIGTDANAPTITAVKNSDATETEKQISYGRPFFIETPQASDITKVVLMRLGAMTHHTDSEQRHIPFQKNASVDGFTLQNNRLRVNMFSDITVTPHGFYMVFIINEAGRPCTEATYVKLDSWIAAPTSSSPCFIATAVYGDILHPKVNFLRNIRDYELSHSQIGVKFANIMNTIYYSFSPQFSNFLIKHHKLKIISKFILVEPVALYLKLCRSCVKQLRLRKTLESSLLAILLTLSILAFIMIILWCIHKLIV